VRVALALLVGFESSAVTRSRPVPNRLPYSLGTKINEGDRSRRLQLNSVIILVPGFVK
jgi:hypothetical protein